MSAVTKAYGGVQALRDVSLKLRPGTIQAIVCNRVGGPLHTRQPRGRTHEQRRDATVFMKTDGRLDLGVV